MALVNRFRAARFRQASASASELDVLLPPPLPLIHLPDEPRLARSGGLDGRPMHLPVRRHVHSEQRNVAPEPNLVERIALQQETDQLPVRARVCVYAYNQPEVSETCGAASDTLVFDALFEGGNLQRADRVVRESVTHEYELWLHPDLRNSAYRQWFYFQVRNAQRGVTYQFSIVNLAKSGALFGAGLQPCVYSEVDAETHSRGWVHAGTHVRYDVSTAPDAPLGTNALHFQYVFPHDHDVVYFACLAPYSYTDLVEYLDRLERDPVRSAFVRRTELCQTIAQNACDLVSITSPPGTPESLAPDDKRLIVLSARVHPGEPNASWMMKGMLDYLTGPSSGAAVLRNHFVFKVVPMLNPDGVINGNTRVNLAGWDLNRKWSAPVEKLFPTVYHLKRLLATWQTRDRVAIYCDLHGHSLNRNIFMYGCFQKRATKRQVAAMAAAVQAATVVPLQPRIKNDPRVFPMLVAKNSDFFSFASCDFKVQKSKLNTARVVVNHELGVINSYTLEASFCGPDFGPRKDSQLSVWDLEDMGRAWCQSLLIYFGLLPHVRALDAARECEPISTVSFANDDDEELRIATPDAALLDLPGDLLSDCEAAISELFASVDLDALDDVAVAPNENGDSDWSDAEDAIPPNNGSDDDSVAPRLSGYVSAPDECSIAKAHGSKKKQLSRRKMTRRKKSVTKKRTPKQHTSQDEEEGPEEQVEFNQDNEDEDANDTDRVVHKRPLKKKKKKKPKRHRRNPSHRASASEPTTDVVAKVSSGRLADVVLPEVSRSASSARVASSSRRSAESGRFDRLPVATSPRSSSGPRRPSKLASNEPFALPPVSTRLTDPLDDDDGDSSSMSESGSNESDAASVC